MKKLMTFLMMLLCTVAVCAQNSDKEDKEWTRQERKAIQARIDSIQHAEALKAIADSAFTLQADHVVFKYGYRAYVESRTNFVRMKDGRATIQVAFNIPVAGPNGMGGVTVEGLVSGYKVTRSKGGETYVNFNVLGAAVSAQVQVTLYAWDSKASVTIMPNFNSNVITLEGALLPVRDSFVIEGRTL